MIAADPADFLLRQHKRLNSGKPSPFSDMLGCINAVQVGYQRMNVRTEVTLDADKTFHFQIRSDRTVEPVPDDGEANDR